jgi:hypothetical protein
VALLGIVPASQSAGEAEGQVEPRSILSKLGGEGETGFHRQEGCMDGDGYTIQGSCLARKGSLH